MRLETGDWRIRELRFEMSVRTPGDEFWNRERVDVVHKLFDDEIVRHAEVGRCESPLGKGEVNSIHAEGDLVLQFACVRPLEAGTVADNEGAFAFVNILQRREPTNTLPPPGVQIRRGQLRQTAE